MPYIVSISISLAGLMLILHTNIRGQLLKVVLLNVFSFIIYAVLTHVLPDAPKDAPVWLLYLLVVVVAYCVVATGASCLGIIRVRFDSATSTVTFRRWWSVTSVPLAALASYHAVTYPTRRSGPVPPGWVLETKDGRRFELAPSNLQALPLLEAELTRLGLQCGAQQQSTYPFTRAL